jgi:hypothetical protein
MPLSLLDQFIQEECTLHVRQLLEEALGRPTTVQTHFEFNRFEVTIAQDVLIEDVLDSAPSGEQRVSRDELASALRRPLDRA